MTNEIEPPATPTGMPANSLEYNDEVHRHIGCVVRLASEVEDAATQLLSWLLNSADPQRVRPLVNGRRLSELVDLLDQLMADYSDKGAYIAALRNLNTYRDGLAHSTRGLVPEDIGNFGVHWMDNQRRRTRTTSSLDLMQARQIEARHWMLLVILETLMLTLVLTANSEDASSILSILELDVQSDPHSFWADVNAMAAAVVILSE